MTVCVPQRRSHGRGPLGGPSLPSPLVPFKIPPRPTHTHRRGVATPATQRVGCRRWRRKQGHRNFQKVKAAAVTAVRGVTVGGTLGERSIHLHNGTATPANQISGPRKRKSAAAGAELAKTSCSLFRKAEAVRWWSSAPV
ncbi:hypothetical protein B296_00048915 [Ensete ventricosum]|uniref:Uncharacterized protein n=1 Tax=Ensete ventricosum TaxID=4639 RepID=A0A426XTL8_ENSVE|nr:hypothetical protein B296_00048915 [Ensete ventricosum]